MRESTKRGAAIDLSDFERRLRGGEPPAPPAADPLTELARLMQGEGQPKAADRLRQVLAAEAPGRSGAARRGPGDAAGPELLRGSLPPEPQNEHGHDSYGQAPHGQDSYVQDPYGHSYGYDDPHAAYGQPQHADVYAHDARHAPAHDPHGHAAGELHAAGAYGAEHGDWQDDPSYLDYGAHPDDGPYGSAPKPEPASRLGRLRRAFRPWHAVAGVAVIAAASIAWGFAHRAGVGGSREIALINPPPGPAKVKPPEGAQGEAQQGATVLDRTESSPVKRVVSNEEQAVDPKLAPQVAKGAPVEQQAEPGALLPEPKKVKTVSVRPDGSVIENESLPPAVAKAAQPPAPDAGAANAGAKRGATPKSPAKPATTPTADKTAKPKPKVAAVQPPAEDAAPAEPENPAAAASKGGFAVQFGAAGTEAEARDLMSKIVAKYGGQLSGHKPSFKMAKVNDKTVYRVRVGGLSKEGATSVCGKVKASGGNCFVAGN